LTAAGPRLGYPSKSLSDTRPDWNSYLAAFHEQRAGITEDVVAHSVDDGHNAYQWLAQVVPSDARLLDVACGSGPLHPLHPWGWVGLDASTSEIARARSLGRGPLVVGDATLGPFATPTIETGPASR